MELGSGNFFATIITIYLCGILASAGGIGGGGVIVPILLVIGKYEYHTATILSLCAVLGNHSAQSTINFPRAHPFNAKRPLISWDLVMVLLPALMGGSSLVGHALPDTLLLLLAIAVLVYAVAKTLRKALQVSRQERSRDVYSAIQQYVSSINCDEKLSIRYVRDLQATRPCTFLLPHDVRFAQTPYSMPAVTFAVGIMCSLLVRDRGVKAGALPSEYDLGRQLLEDVHLLLEVVEGVETWLNKLLQLQ
eukprot:gene34562-41850_t